MGHSLADVYARKFDVLNRGYSGYNTEWALPVLEQVRLRPPSNSAVGSSPDSMNNTTSRASDCSRSGLGPTTRACRGTSQHVPLSRFAENLRTMLRMITSASSPYYMPDTKIIFISAPPVNTYQRGADLAHRDPPRDLDRNFETTRTYAEEVVKLGEREGVPVVDAWTRLWEAAGKEERALETYLYDGLHVNEAGYKVVYDGIVEVIAKYYPELRHEEVKYKLPSWDYFFDHTVEDFRKEYGLVVR
ncbi:hypothetical protein EW146_g10146 [Bondarzewia mesenterica]|uniref:SGNH hydrolase-type esterase domain-containing protein n=1 Tax=Bondarzewia mesenterica TaxID=1095465 RepID=A0A4S4L4S5_9AGAM|nr:hypothetical protein EW146_g10146 [Bondarzewia mesenterica]